MMGWMIRVGGMAFGGHINGVHVTAEVRLCYCNDTSGSYQTMNLRW